MMVIVVSPDMTDFLSGVETVCGRALAARPTLFHEAISSRTVEVMADTSYSPDDLTEWEQSVNVLRYGPHEDPSDVREAVEATANLCSAWGGWMDMPEEISNIVIRAVETGYLNALADVRAGRVSGLGEVDDA
ncbi:hypothetical protein [Nonomuraea dietziae]|uniref:Uncharacterized protein n=1 Tax=Nonomuraea dietziae TaxID=65515 RepID=A0A7W5V9A0_9ACTN|nr:hypothetical protein [Nonomuraea dietziae]MBB3728128.1 hypothetical protein [Nonomuraea dietziae]